MEEHYVSFVRAKIVGEERLVELDGAQPTTGPVDWGRSDDLLQVREASMSLDVG